MADYLGEKEKAEEYRALFAKGYAYTKENLFNGKSIDNSIKEALGNMADTQPIEDLICDGFIHLNSLKQNNDTGLRKKCFTRKEFESILRCKAVGKR